MQFTSFDVRKHADVQSVAITGYGLLGFMEIVLLSGFYQMFSAINQGLGVTLPEGAAAPF
jgi:4-carboxymuconolactone decarboxylase